MIVPMFQGIHCAETGERVGAETLARWLWNGTWSGPQNHPLPTSWPKVDQASLDFITRNADVVKQQYPTITINICPDTLKNETAFQLWRDRVTALQKESDLELIGEITERVPDDLLMHSWGKLADTGISLYMDDFGHDFSTLERLHKYPWDGCKFDIKAITADTECVKNWKALDLCCKRGIDTVAEQVETSELAREAKALNFHWLQGFHFGRAEMLIPSGPGLWKPANLPLVI